MQEDEVRVQRITLAVEDVRHVLHIPTTLEPLYRTAASELNRAVLIYKNRYPDITPVSTYLSMAAVDAAYRAVQLRQQLEARDWAERLSSLSDQIEALFPLVTSDL